MSYLDNLRSDNTTVVLNRKKEYVRYNFSKYFRSRLTQHASVLEIGPGLGEFISYCNDIEITSIDVVDNDVHILEFIKKTYTVKKILKSDDITLVQDKLGMYDVITMTQVLEHIPVEKHIAYIQALYRILKKGGVILITVPNIGNPLAIFERYYDYTHQTAFTEHSLVQMTNMAGLKSAVVSVQPFRIPLYNAINIVRYIFQQLLHSFFRLCYIINGGVYPQVLTTNITLAIEKTV